MTTEELKNAAGFKAVDAEGKELGIVALSDIVSAVKQELQPANVAPASVAPLSEVSTLAATDTYEDQLPQKTDVTWVRGLDAEGNPILISKQSLASVLEELMSSMGLFPYNKTTLLTTDFNSIDKSGWQLITNGQEMINRPSFMEDNYWFIESIKDKENYFLVRVTNLKMRQAIRTCNAGAWSGWKEL